MLFTELLTPRELEIARLVARGYSNRRIADELVIASSTAERHVANILAKLKMRTRTQLAVWVAEQGLMQMPAHLPSVASALEVEATSAVGQLRSNLAVESSSFVGREQELRELSHVVQKDRLLTLVGPGGVGKSRLALRVAHSVLPTFPDGVWVVEIGPLSNPQYVLSAVSTALGIAHHPGLDLRHVLAEWLRPKRLLLVLDNCEHLVQSCAELVQNLLHSCLDLRVLVTSREALRLREEHVFPVPPLDLPPADRAAPAAALVQPASVQLFKDRAGQLVPDFRVTPNLARSVADICLRLDGLPLAIELAAARIKVLSPAQLLVRLDHSLPLLVGGARDLPARQRTLRDTIAWSHALLTPGDQRLFRNLAVFTGGCSLGAAETLNQADLDPGGSVLDGLASLVDKHLLRGPDSLVGEPRFVMLETIREFALEQLQNCGEEGIVRERHARHFLSLAEQGESAMHRNLADMEWLQCLEREHDNLRTAMRWAEEAGVVELELRLASAVAPFRMRAGHWREGFAQLMGALSRDDPALPDVRAQALGYAAYMACSLQEWAKGERLVDEGLPLAQELGNPLTLAVLLRAQAGLAVAQRRFPEAMQLLEQAIDRLEGAEDKFVGILRLFRLQHATYVLALGNRERSRVLFELNLTEALASGDRFVCGGALIGLGTIALLQGDLERSVAQTSESFQFASQSGDPLVAHLCLLELATIAGRQARWRRVARFLGAAEMLRERHGSRPVISERLRERIGTNDAVATAQAELGKVTFDAEYEAGSAMSPEQTLAEVLAKD
jgi:non-specific serine/threonine protein kinase